MAVFRWRRRYILPALIALLTLTATFGWPLSSPISAAAANASVTPRHTQTVSLNDWTTYGFNNARTNYNPHETAITPLTAPTLKVMWRNQTVGRMTSQALVSNGAVYWGTWDGYEHAATTSNAPLWSTFVGTSVLGCSATTKPPTAGTVNIGVADTGALALVNNVPTLFTGGGDSAFYALNAQTGAILWRTSLGTPPGYFLWSSPAFYQGSIYIGVSAQGDCPLEQAQFVRLNATTGVVQNTFNVVPNGCTGGSVWGSPTIDEAAGTVYFTTGNPGNCGSNETFTDAIIELKTADLTLVDHWQIPASQNVNDGDIGNTPTLFTATINGAVHQMVAVAGKNGYYYAFDRSGLSAGPVWEDQIAVGGSCPECGQGSISPSAWDGSSLYVAGGNSTIGGASCVSTLRALNPANGAYRWQDCLPGGPVLGAVTAAPGVVAINQGNTIMVMLSLTGATIFQYRDPAGDPFQGPVTISNGMLFDGNNDDHLYALAPGQGLGPAL